LGLSYVEKNSIIAKKCVGGELCLFCKRVRGGIVGRVYFILFHRLLGRLILIPFFIRRICIEMTKGLITKSAYNISSVNYLKNMFHTQKRQLNYKAYNIYSFGSADHTRVLSPHSKSILPKEGYIFRRVRRSSQHKVP